MKTGGGIARSAAEPAAIPFAIALPVKIGLMGLAIDLAYMYSRKNELQQVAGAAVLAAARELNGTKKGVLAARAATKNVVDTAAHGFGKSLDWSNDVLMFAQSVTATSDSWKSYDTTNSDCAAPGYLFAKIDTEKLTDTATGDMPGAITTFFPHGDAGASPVDMSAGAVAGPTWVNVTPRAICALNTTPSGTRTYVDLPAEKIEYGFRRGVSYNLLDLSPNSTTPQAYLVNPVGTSNTANFADDVVKLFFCSGTMPLTTLGQGSPIYVKSLGTTPIHDWLNSRFDDAPAVTGCDPAMAPPDTNIKEYIGGYSDWYMAAVPNHAFAERADANSIKRVTYADLVAADTLNPAPIPAPTEKSFGPLWTYSKPVTESGAVYALADWPKLDKFGGAAVTAGTTTGATCERFVRVRLCRVSDGVCAKVPYQPLVSLLGINSLQVDMPFFTAVAPLETMGTPGDCS